MGAGLSRLSRFRLRPRSELYKVIHLKNMISINTGVFTMFFLSCLGSKYSWVTVGKTWKVGCDYGNEKWRWREKDHWRFDF